MSEIRISSRYALSLFDLSIEQKNLEQVKNDMKMFADTCHANHELVNILKSPIIDGDKKAAVLDGIFSKHFNALSLVFMRTIIRKRREKYLPAVAAEFLEMYKANMNIVTAYVTTANAINDAVKKQIQDNLQKQTGKTVELHANVDAKLIGGIKIQVGDKLFDDSIAKQLNNLKLHLLN
jgi:F-type H+-transporting ATPase subunit delta